MPTLVSDVFHVPREAFRTLGCFNTVLDLDSRFFLNFTRVKETAAPELAPSYDRIIDLFNAIGVLLNASRGEYDRFYREAYARLQMSEFQEVCLGYSITGTAGSGSGRRLKNLILTTGKEIIDAGVNEPEIFQLVGLFEDGVGPDRLSDMIARTIAEDLEKYTRRVIRSLSELEGFTSLPSTSGGIPINPCSGVPLLLVPEDILHELPVATTWDDIDAVYAMNSELRRRINDAIGSEWAKLSTSSKKRHVKRQLLSDPELLHELIREYRESHLEPYDFRRDPLGESLWIELAKSYTKTFPLTFALRTVKTQPDLLAVVRTICLRFKQLLETNGLNEVLYRDDGSPRHERIAQKTFYAVADWYCEANNMDISPEVNSGRGPVDFKFTVGYNNKVLVEVKLTTNTHLVHGYEKQLKEYAAAERTNDAFYLVIDNGGPQRRLERVIELDAEYRRRSVKAHELVVIDARVRPSASRA